MKKIIMAILILLMVSPAFALFGGETVSYNFSKCNYLTVNITPCEDNEWTVENCIEESIGNFYCSCNDDYNLNLTPAVNSVGTFVITMTNFYEEEQPIVRQVFIPSSGNFVPSGGMCRIDGCMPGYECVIPEGEYWGRCLKKEIKFEEILNESNRTVEIEIVEPIIIGESVSTPQSVESNVEIYITIIGIIVFIVLIFYLLYKRYITTTTLNPSDANI